MSDFDTVFVGSGINALVPAALLANAGRSVAVFERADELGGAIRTVELFPGFHHDLFSTSHALFVASGAYRVLRERLAAHGLRYARGEVPAATLFPNASAVFLTTSREANVQALDRLASGDGAAWRGLADELDGHADLVQALLSVELAGLDGVRLALRARHRLGWSGAVELSGTMLQTCRDVLETSFSSELARGLFAPWVLHAGVGPEAAGSSFMMRMIARSLEAHGTSMPVGGGARLVEALAAIVREEGGVCTPGNDVVRIIVRRGRAVGVRLANGTEIGARRAVVADVTPTQLYARLLEGVPLKTSVRQAASRFRYGRARMQLHLALREPPLWDGGSALLDAATIHISGGLDAVSRAVNEAERGLLPAEPTLTCAQPVAVDPSRAPEGGWILSVQLHEVPWRPRGDAAGEIPTGDGTWNERLAEQFADRALRRLERHAPNLESALVYRTVLSPADFATLNVNFVNGDGASGACTLDQSLLWRPRPELPGHRTPVRDLFHVGASTHPGPGLGAGSGMIVAQRLLQRRASHPLRR